MSVTTCAQQIIQSSQSLSRPELPAAFWELVEQYRAELVNQALAITGDLHDAEDVVQETFCEAFKDRGRLKNVRSIGAWLRSINRDNALDRLRRNKRDSKRVKPADREYTTGGFNLLEMRDLVAKSVEKLPAKMRLAVVLCYWEHLTPEQIAQRLQVSPRTARRLLFEASALLFDNLEPHLSQPELSAQAPQCSTPQSNAAAAATQGEMQ